MNEGPPSSIPLWKEPSHTCNSVSGSAGCDLVFCCPLRVAVVLFKTNKAQLHITTDRRSS